MMEKKCKCINTQREREQVKERGGREGGGQASGVD